MKSIKATIELLSYWHVGSGISRGADVDSTALKDDCGLPFIPGREIKGLFREAFLTMEEAKQLYEGKTDELFGKMAEKNDDSGSKPGKLRFTVASVPEPEKSWLSSKDCRKYSAGLFVPIASTRLNNNGIAVDKSLRTIEVCIPMKLETLIEGPENEDWDQHAARAAKLIRQLGSGRSRGFGRCRIQFDTEN